MIELIQSAVRVAKNYPDEHRDLVLQTLLLEEHLRSSAPDTRTFQQQKRWARRYKDKFGNPHSNQVVAQLSEQMGELYAIYREFRKQTEGGAVTVRQVAYQPKSEGPRINTLTPENLADVTQMALHVIEAKIGNFDEFVCDRLGYGSKEELWNCLAAEQVDAVAMSIFNIENGGALISGEQPGVGKGRICAAMMRYAIRRGLIPIFFTKEAKLYEVCMRDLTAVGVANFEPLVTDSSFNLKLPGGRAIQTMTREVHDQHLKNMMDRGSIAPYDGILCSYTQTQTVKRQEPFRREFLRWAADNALLILDESHEAGGGTSKAMFGAKKDISGEEIKNRADFMRELVQRARGVHYSSATYAKAAHHMSLYQATDMRLATEGNLDELTRILSFGGVPLSQTVSAAQAAAGQYLRRERSFEGIEVLTELLEVDYEVSESLADCLKAILQFDILKEQFRSEFERELRSQAKALHTDTAVGEPSISGLHFSSLLHNVIGQYLLAIKAEPAVEKTLEVLRNGEKAVLSVDNTMGSFIGKMAKDLGIQPGEILKLTFGDLLLRYLRRTRVLLVTDEKGVTRQEFIPDEELERIMNKDAIATYNDAEKVILAADFSSIPVSPLDWIRFRLQQEGYEMAEITGREHCIDYTEQGVGTYRRRGTKERGTSAGLRARDSFNSGLVDVILINRSGSTGIDLHSSQDFVDQRRRVMLILQTEQDINLFIQKLGRVHRTGQVIAPRYIFLVADTPAENRLAAVAIKKLASLNANTTAARKGGFEIEGAVDYFNIIGDRACAIVGEDNPDLYREMGSPLDEYEPQEEGAIARRFTGRIPLLRIPDQERIYRLLEDQFLAEVEESHNRGESILEARTLDLRAKTLSEEILIPAFGNSPFESAVTLEVAEVQVLDRPNSQLDAANAVRKALGMDAVKSLKHHDWAEVRSLGSEESTRAIKQLQQESLAYLDTQLDRYPELGADAGRDKRAKRQARRDEITRTISDGFDVITKAIRELPVGTPVRIERQVATQRGGFITETDYGVVVFCGRRSSAARNPLAIANWEIRIMEAGERGGIRTKKFKHIHFSRIPEKDARYGDYITPCDSVPVIGKTVFEYYDVYREREWQQRNILTGNLLHAVYKQLHWYGTLINFTRPDGRVQAGLLLRKDIDIKEELEKRPISVPRLIAQSALDRGARLSTQDGVLSVYEKRGHYELETSTSNMQGGRYFKNPDLLRAIGDDFYSIGGRMLAVVRNERIDSVLQLFSWFASGDSKTIVRNLGLNDEATD